MQIDKKVLTRTLFGLILQVNGFYVAILVLIRYSSIRIRMDTFNLNLTRQYQQELVLVLVI